MRMIWNDQDVNGITLSGVDNPILLGHFLTLRKVRIWLCKTRYITGGSSAGSMIERGIQSHTGARGGLMHALNPVLLT